MRLLQIDDDPFVGGVFQKLARSCGYDTQLTDQSKTFKVAYESFKPDVVVLDLEMPGMDGIELLRFLADAKCRAKILIVSGLGDKVLETAERLAGARGLNIAGTLRKPTPAADLRSALNGLKENCVLNG
jgi:CheY-like chemotaxis protein